MGGIVVRTLCKFIYYNCFSALTVIKPGQGQGQGLTFTTGSHYPDRSRMNLASSPSQLASIRVDMNK